jgi:hypothetical protein
MAMSPFRLTASPAAPCCLPATVVSGASPVVLSPLIVVGGRLRTQRLEYAREGELELVAWRTLGMVGPRRLYCLAVALEICLLQLAELGLLRELRLQLRAFGLEPCHPLLQLAALRAGRFGSPTQLSASLAIAHAQDAPINNYVSIPRNPRMIFPQKIG